MGRGGATAAGVTPNGAGEEIFDALGSALPVVTPTFVAGVFDTGASA